jgi:hypothetical protein
LPGIKGYSFYAIQGTKKLFFDATLRMPLFMSKHYKLKWMTIQNSTVGFITQIGDAWENNNFSIKKSLGIQLRINGFSFYNFPTAIELEYHQPITTFNRSVNKKNITYGPDENGFNNKTYVKILFDF